MASDDGSAGRVREESRRDVRQSLFVYKRVQGLGLAGPGAEFQLNHGHVACPDESGVWDKVGDMIAVFGPCYRPCGTGSELERGEGVLGTPSRKTNADDGFLRISGRNIHLACIG